MTKWSNTALGMTGSLVHYWTLDGRRRRSTRFAAEPPARLRIDERLRRPSSSSRKLDVSNRYYEPKLPPPWWASYVTLYRIHGHLGTRTRLKPIH